MTFLIYQLFFHRHAQRERKKKKKKESEKKVYRREERKRKKKKKNKEAAKKRKKRVNYMEFYFKICATKLCKGHVNVNMCFFNDGIDNLSESVAE